MSLFNRAWLSLIRKPVKSILLAGILMLISLLLMTAVGIDSRQSLVQNQILNEVGGNLRLELNWNEQLGAHGKPINTTLLDIGGGVMGFQNQLPTIQKADFKQISNVPGVEHANLSSQMLLLNPLNFENDQTQASRGRYNPADDLVSVVGTLRGDLVDEAARGFISLSEGRWIEAGDWGDLENPIMISEAVAQKNGVTIGDVLDLEWTDTEFDVALDYFGWEREESRQITGLIVGIFAVDQKMETSNNRSLENLILADLGFWEKLFEGTRMQDYSYNLATFHVEDIAEYDAVKEAVSELDLNWELYDLIDSTEMLERLSSGFEGLNRLSTMMYWIVLGTGFAMLLLIFILWIRSRHYEIAILLAVGISKTKIIAQMILEAMLITGIAFFMAFMSLPVTGNLLDISSLNDQFQQETPFYIEIDGEYVAVNPDEFSSFTHASTESIMSSEFYQQATSGIQITLESTAMVKLSLMAIVSFSILAAVGPVVKMNPKEIFSNAK
jgi:putative ABC transport system permease protein